MSGEPHRLPATVTLTTTPAVLEQAARALDAGARVFELSGCEHFDSALIGLLLDLRRRAQALGARCEFTHPSSRLLTLARLYGVDPLLFGEPA